MLLVPQATSHALQMIRIASEKMVSFPVLLLLIGICIISLSLFLALFFLIQYSYFGVNVVDFSTVINFLGCPITTHVLQTIFCIISFIIAMLIVVIFSYSVTYILICNGLHEKPSFKQFCVIFKTSFNELVRQAVVMTLGYLAWVFSWMYFSERLEDLQDMCDGSYVPDEGKYYDPFAILLYPLLVTNPGVMLKDIRAESVVIMQKTFTENAVCQYTFSYISYVFAGVTSLLMYGLWKYKITEIEQAFLIELVLFVIYWSVIRLITITFAVSVYHYCVGKDFLVYPSEFIMKSYKKQKRE